MSDVNPMGKITAPLYPALTADRRASAGSTAAAETPAHKTATHLDKACKDLESLFVYYLLKEMRASIPKAGLLEADKSKDVYTSIMDAEMAKQLAQGRGVGLAAMLRQQLAGSLPAAEPEKQPK